MARVKQNGVGGSFSVIQQGSKVVGATTVPLVDEPTPCSAVWVGAPTANHTPGANTSALLVGGIDLAGGGNVVGGRVLANDDTVGILFLIDDAANLHITGLSANDTVQYQIYK